MVAGIVKMFETSISNTIALASFLPLIPLMGGNVAIQASTIVVRGIALGDISGGNTVRMVARELSVAVVLGVVCSTIVGLVAGIAYGLPALAGVVAAAVFAAVVIAVLMGTAVPLLFNAIGVDAALAAGPLVTILNDLVSIAAYLGLATLLLKLN